MDKQLREDWLRAVYETQGAGGYSHAAHMAPLLGMDPYGDMNDRDLWRRIGRYWKERGFIRGQSTKTGLAYETVMITADGIRHVEDGEKVIPPQGPTFNIFGDTYGSVIGTQDHAQILQPTFTFGDLEQEIDHQGGEDAEALREMVQEIRDTLENQDSLSRGKLLEYSELLNRHAWITGPIAQLLLVYATTGQIS